MKPSQVDRCVVFSGHMIDQPDRPSPRFPPSKENVVRDRISAQLDQWQMGHDDLAICGGAQGGDIIFAECCLQRHLSIRLCIALPDDEFISRSVRLEGANWEVRYQKLSQSPNVKRQYLHHVINSLPPDIQAIKNIFAQTNCWILNEAQNFDKRLFGILVWDQKGAADGPGGTADFAARLSAQDAQIRIINPRLL